MEGDLDLQDPQFTVRERGWSQANKAHSSPFKAALTLSDQASAWGRNACGLVTCLPNCPGKRTNNNTSPLSFKGQRSALVLTMWGRLGQNSEHFISFWSLLGSAKTKENKALRCPGYDDKALSPWGKENHILGHLIKAPSPGNDGTQRLGTSRARKALGSEGTRALTPSLLRFSIIRIFLEGTRCP